MTYQSVRVNIYCRDDTFFCLVYYVERASEKECEREGRERRG